MQDPNANFYQIQADFNNYWATRDNTEKGNLSLLSLTAKNFQDFLDTYQAPNA
eukprot:gene1548-1933_t